jgi:3-isopropylmalate/(R)-2-methylmalate dehydratase small subunit
VAEPFTTLKSGTIVLAQNSIDTDQIIPARFLTTTSRKGLGAHAFHDWRYDITGAPIADFVLNTVDSSAHRILIAGDNFACGSSREHAPWALLDYGLRAIISTKIADIFTSNALKNGLLPIELDEASVRELMERPGAEVTIDLENQEVRWGNHGAAPFKTEPFARRCLLDGVDPLGWLLERRGMIEAHERTHNLETGL